MKITIKGKDIYADKEMKLITKEGEKTYNKSNCLEFVVNEKELEEISKIEELEVNNSRARIYYVEYVGKGMFKVYIRTSGETIRV